MWWWLTVFQQRRVPFLQAVYVAIDTDTAVNLRGGATIPQVYLLLWISFVRFVGREATGSCHRVNVHKPSSIHVAIATRRTSKFWVRRAIQRHGHGQHSILTEMLKSFHCFYLSLESDKREAMIDWLNLEPCVWGWHLNHGWYLNIFMFHCWCNVKNHFYHYGTLKRCKEIKRNDTSNGNSKESENQK